MPAAVLEVENLQKVFLRGFMRRRTVAVDGIGFSLSYSNTRSSLHEDNNLSKPLDGLSGVATNFTVYYERHGLSARVGSRHRSPFVTTVRGTFGEKDRKSVV